MPPSRYNLQTPNFEFFEKSAFEPGLLSFEKHNPFYELVVFPCFLPNPCTRMCVSTMGFFFGDITWKTILKH